ncbi:unnamed protein product [Gongylonema pulchrum]|uniref:Transposase n=1 Tax=Gongylonema pulchrum TaxID=637853 RepID=A0A183F0J9_9BILA|nr:unnamed protein product [Gongylonema pulchrum]
MPNVHREKRHFEIAAKIARLAVPSSGTMDARHSGELINRQCSTGQSFQYAFLLPVAAL